MPQVSLAKALKLKNRQIQKVRDLNSRIQSSNRYLPNSEPDFDAPALFKQLKTETEKLWKLKAAINAANAPIQPFIYEMAEQKGLITFLKGLNDPLTMHNPLGYYAPQVLGERPAMQVQISPATAQAEIEALEARIDDLQDRIDAHNAQVTIEVDL